MGGRRGGGGGEAVRRSPKQLAASAAAVVRLQRPQCRPPNTTKKNPIKTRNSQHHCSLTTTDNISTIQTHSKIQNSKQVQLAQVEYQLPRLTRMWTHLDRQSGGGRVKGSGEKQIETDKRLLRDRAAALRR